MNAANQLSRPDPELIDEPDPEVASENRRLRRLMATAAAILIGIPAAIVAYAANVAAVDTGDLVTIAAYATAYAWMTLSVTAMVIFTAKPVAARWLGLAPTKGDEREQKIELRVTNLVYTLLLLTLMLIGAIRRDMLLICLSSLAPSTSFALYLWMARIARRIP